MFSDLLLFKFDKPVQNQRLFKKKFNYKSKLIFLKLLFIALSIKELFEMKE
jgi:hypothetical protein